MTRLAPPREARPLRRAALLAALAATLAAAGCTATGRPTPTDPGSTPERPAVPHEPMVEDALRPLTDARAAPPRGPAPTAPDAERRVETVRLGLSGLSCPIKCTREVREMLKPVAGVVHVVVDFDSKQAVVTVERGTDPRALVEAVHDPYAARLL